MKNQTYALLAIGALGLLLLGPSADAKTNVPKALEQLKTNEVNAKANFKQYKENEDISGQNIVEATAAVKKLRDQKQQLSSNAANLEKNRAILDQMKTKYKEYQAQESKVMEQEAAEIARLQALLDKLEANRLARQKNIESYDAKIAEVDNEKASWDAQSAAFAEVQREIASKETEALAARQKWIDKRKEYRAEAVKWQKESKIAENHRAKFARLKD